MVTYLTGASGLVGSALTARLAAAGHTVRRLVRPGPTPRPGDVIWDPGAERLDESALLAADAVIHLAGANLASPPWTPLKKARFRDSRIHATRILSEALARLPQPPACLIVASAVGYYGNRGAEPLTEQSGAGTGFLAELCADWERAADAARGAGIRVAHVRTGLALAAKGGALAPMRAAFRLGVGGPLGSGAQYWSWIALEDLVRVYQWAVEEAAADGPVNAVAPSPVTNAEFARVLGAVLHRPAALRAPAWTLRLGLGEMADEMLLSSSRVVPAKLRAAEFRFEFPELEPALRSILAR